MTPDNPSTASPGKAMSADEAARQWLLLSHYAAEHAGTPDFDNEVTYLARFLTTLTARVRAEERAKVLDIGWLVERNSMWWAASPHTEWTIRNAVNHIFPENWTHTAADALRFARKIDAETFIHFHGWQNVAATEHVFNCALAPLPETKGGEG